MVYVKTRSEKFASSQSPAIISLSSGVQYSEPGALGAKFKLKSNSKSSASSPEEELLEEEEDVETDLDDAGWILKVALGHCCRRVDASECLRCPTKRGGDDIILEQLQLTQYSMFYSNHIAMSFPSCGCINTVVHLTGDLETVAVTGSGVTQPSEEAITEKLTPPLAPTFHICSLLHGSELCEVRWLRESKSIHLASAAYQVSSALSLLPCCVCAPDRVDVGDDLCSISIVEPPFSSQEALRVQQIPDDVLTGGLSDWSTSSHDSSKSANGTQIHEPRKPAQTHLKPAIWPRLEDRAAASASDGPTARPSSRHSASSAEAVSAGGILHFLLHGEKEQPDRSFEAFTHVSRNIESPVRCSAM
ncbi:hypothetical protein EYF80_009514 [Liparis tanakae]|uniref:Uncharacterized protein n=1 Tax=Liparis tanakae TaxID=230148 RepID=A0A4Z2IQE9_9TELE|nr:hypothetical protein EYF80_009514 [Liparis tanakae]